MRTDRALMFAKKLTLIGAAFVMITPALAAPPRPQGPCDVYAKAGDPCVAAHSTTRAMYAAYNGPLYQVLRQSDGKKLDIGVVQPSGSDAGGYADAAAQDRFCANTYCWITTIYDQSGRKNDLTQAPRGAFSGPAMGGFNNVPVADMAPISIMGHKVYGAFIVPGMGLREDDQKGVAVDDQAEGQYWVVSGKHYNGGCCFDYGNAEIDSHDDDAGTMETAYFGDATPWYHGNPPGPWVMTDQENNLVGCVNPGSTSKLCPQLPDMTSRFVTAMAKGEPHHWTTLGGDSQQGALAVMFDGPRVDWGYDPMRKQGAILLGNGGDNSNGSQGTFYEGAVTAAKTFPTDATDQLVQANVVAAHYAVQAVSLKPAAAEFAPGLQTFTPGSSQDVTVAFTNTSNAPATGVKLNINAPQGWTAVATGTNSAASVAPGASVSATFKVTSGASAFNGDLVADASWTAGGVSKSDRTAEKVRNVPAVKINEFSTQATQPFIELYNDSASLVDLSGWTVTEHPTQQAIFSDVKVPAGTKLAPHGFYLLGMSNSGLAAGAKAGDKTIFVRSATGISAGDTLHIGTAAEMETSKVATVGTAAGASTTLWEPLPEGPIMTVPAGSTNVPVTSTAGFEVGQKIALGHGATYPAVSNGRESYEVATVTSVGKPGTLSLTAATARAGDTNLKVMSTANISPGDKIRLDVDSVDHGVEWITVKSVGTQGTRMTLASDAAAGATTIEVRAGFRGPGGGGEAPVKAGDEVIIGTPATWQTVTVSSVGNGQQGAMTLAISPALHAAHATRENVMYPGTGLELEAPLKFTHSANLPFSDRGTGITFSPATAFAHSSNEPVTALGTGITLVSALAHAHGVDAVVHDPAVTTAGYQGSPAPNQWFGGPELSPAAGNIVLRDAAGLVVDSLNYGLVVDPWAAEGFQGNSPAETSGCRAPALGAAGRGFRGAAPPVEPARSAGRFPDGADTDSNCADFHVQSAATLAAAASAGASNIKVSSVEGFSAGQAIQIGSGADRETATIASVGTPGASRSDGAVAAGATSVPVANAFSFRPGQTITVGEGPDAETATVANGGRRGAPIVMVESPLKNAHPAGTLVAGTGITLTSALKTAHAGGASVADHVPTPGAPNQYSATIR